MFLTAIIAAAGEGTRLNFDIPKPLVRISSKPVIIYSLERLSKYSLVRDIIIAANLSNIKGIKQQIERYEIKKIKDIVLGGKRRQDSVRNGLIASDSRSDFVLIHDAARPFIGNEVLPVLIKQAKKYGAAIVGVPVKSTIKEAQGSGLKANIVKRTLDRKNLWEVQTPQVFKKDLLLEAYDRFGDIDVTDDAMLLEKMRVKVGMVFGSYDNIKITTPEDLIIAEAIARHKNKGF